MKLDIQEILERFALIASLPMEEAVGYTALCSDAAGELTRRLRGTVSENKRFPPGTRGRKPGLLPVRHVPGRQRGGLHRWRYHRGQRQGMTRFGLAREVWMEAEREIATCCRMTALCSAGCEYEKIRGSPQADKALRPECKTGDGGHRRDQERPGGDPASALPEQR